GSADNSKEMDQPEITDRQRLTQNGLFHRAAQEYRAGNRAPERVRVYEKIKDGIWSYNGVFHLVDSWRERDELRSVFKFRLVGRRRRGPIKTSVRGNRTPQAHTNLG